MKWLCITVLAGLVGCGGGPQVGDRSADPEHAGGVETGGAEAEADPPPAAAVERPRPTEKAIKQAIRELGASKKRVRDRATEKLIMFGAAAVDELKAARARTDDPERAVRIETVLRVLGEEGPYTEAIDLLLQQRYDEAVPLLRRYLQFAQGRYRAQAEYLADQALGLAQWQQLNRPLTGQSARTKLEAEGLWRYGTYHHNVYLFFKQRDIDAPVFYDEASDLYGLATERSPSHRRSWANRAALLAAGGEREEAEKSFEQALTIAKSSGWDLMDLALYYVAAGRNDRAIDLIEQAIPVVNAERQQALDGGTPEDEAGPEARWWCRESNDFDALKEDSRFLAVVRDR